MYLVTYISRPSNETCICSVRVKTEIEPYCLHAFSKLLFNFFSIQNLDIWEMKFIFSQINRSVQQSRRYIMLELLYIFVLIIR